jgi:hypothetical protein
VVVNRRSIRAVRVHFDLAVGRNPTVVALVHLATPYSTLCSDNTDATEVARNALLDRRFVSIVLSHVRSSNPRGMSIRKILPVF